MNLPHAPNENRVDNALTSAECETRRCRNTRRLLVINRDLEGISNLDLNEARLDREWDRLPSPGTRDAEIFWLTRARIMELALICAGNYADNCESRAAGDFLANPRCIKVHLKGISEPIVKERHSPLSVQLADYIDSDLNPACVLRNIAIAEIKKEPLLVQMYDSLKGSDRIASDYLLSVQFRMKRMVDAIGFLSAWKIRDSADLHERLQSADSMARAFVESNLCRFDRKLFDALGGDILRISENPDYKSGFIKDSPPSTLSCN